MEKYNHQKIEEKWQERWTKEKLYEHKDEPEKKKYYVLDMFPYPSGDGLHMGHTESYTASDIIYRFKKMQGYDVLHPQGFDSFGLPAENYAVKTGIHPEKTTKKNTDNYLRQMKMLGLGHDLKNLIYTSDPSYYKWTQYIFGKFFQNGLVERKMDKINWCPSCQTSIANEQVVDGRCERCKTKIEQKEVLGWFFKITDFAEDLINDLDKLDWPESTKKNQKNWIGRSEGSLLKFPIFNFQFSNDEKIYAGKKNKIGEITVFTTRPDTLFGVTYLVVAPEHSLIENEKIRIKNYDEVEKYVRQAKNKTERERIENKEKTGVELKGIKAINPANGEEVPIFVADYVLGEYGTGAIMAVPAHDNRDYEFAKKFKLKIKKVISGKNISEEIYTGEGKLINSGKFDGMESEKAKKKITEFVGGEITSNYRLRDWSVSRQRYWGCPIPIVYSPEGEAKFVGEENLPWLLPKDVDFTPTGESPLKKSKELKERTEKLFGQNWIPEVDTLDTFVDSSWYFLRYPDTKNEKEFCAPEKLKRWLPVDLYIGGAEHTYLHLLYARFFIKALKKIGLIDFDEPFLKLRHQGMVLDKNGVKMSKSKGNVVNPDEMVSKFGADATRMYMMFAGPLEDDVMWNEEGVKGVYRFLEKVWNLFQNYKLVLNSEEQISKELSFLLNKTIKGVTEDIEELKFNTAISKLMIFINNIKNKKLSKTVIEKFLILLAPFAPHISEELWERMRNKKLIFLEKWPTYDPELIKEETIEMVVQINGKVRDRIEASVNISDEEAKKLAISSEKTQKYISGKKIKKVIFVAGRLVNIVIE